MRQKKYLLQESEIPKAWFNIQAVMPNKPLPFLHPATRQPLKPEDLYPIFCKECSDQELNQKDEWIEIPEEARQQYASYRCTPLERAYEGIVPGSRQDRPWPFAACGKSNGNSIEL